MLMLAIRLILKIKGGKQHFLPFVGSNLEVETFLKKREHQKRMCQNRALKHLCILCIGLQENSLQNLSAFYFYFFWLLKGILKALFTFIF